MTLKQYLVLLATDQKHLDSFVADAKRAMERAELSDEDRSALLCGSQALIHSKLTIDDPVRG